MTAWGISFDPVLAWPLLVVLGLLGLVAVALLAIARNRGWWLRAIALTLLFAALLEPTVSREVREALSDIAVIVVDRSLSMSAARREADVDKAVERLRQEAATLDNLEMRQVEVRSGLSGGDHGTLAFAALDRALAEIPPERFAGAIVVSDGQIHDAPDAAHPLRVGPLHGVIAGKPSERDRRIVIDASPRFGLVGQTQTIRFHVEETGGDGSPLSVSVATGEGAAESLTLASGEVAEFPLNIGHGGQNIVEISVAEQEREISVANNRAIAVIEGIRDRLRVLLISGAPHAGERTWRNLLKADASVDLLHFTILRPPEKQDGTPINELSLIAFPTRELFVDKLDQFDLVIFDRYRRQVVLPMAYLRNVARYVEEGGAVLIASGPEFAVADGLFDTPLSEVIPAAPTGGVVEGPFRPAITADGLKHPVTRGLPGGGDGGAARWGRWFRVIDALPDRGMRVMAGGPDGSKPLLVLSHEGKGRVAQILSDQGWLWARGFDGGGPQSELLRRIAHWLMQEPDLEEEALNGHQEAGNLVIERRTMKDRVDPVTVTLPSGRKETVTLQAFEPGLWRGQ
ncbi:MAG: hypothetical protein FJX63_06750, partial [Alphaproteobacteria bacterium]|nr:hypothetical protein [Alphaproteobacteria bacterium]